MPEIGAPLHGLEGRVGPRLRTGAATHGAYVATRDEPPLAASRSVARLTFSTMATRESARAAKTPTARVSSALVGRPPKKVGNIWLLVSTYV